MGLLGPERLGRIELVVVRRRRAAACRPRLALDAFSFARVRVSARVLRLRFDYPGRGPLNALVTTRRPGAEAARLRAGAHRVSVGKLHDNADSAQTTTLVIPLTRHGRRILAPVQAPELRCGQGPKSHGITLSRSVSSASGPSARRRASGRRTCKLICAWGSSPSAALNRAMLSLATLQGGTSVTYWLAQAEGRVTHSESVSSGVEDYYLAGPEAVGQWTGEGIAGLGLGGEVTEEALTRLLDRKDPRSGEPLPRPARGRPPEVDGFQNTNVFVVRGKRRSNFAADVSRGTRGQDHRHSTVSTRRSPPLEVEAPCARGWTWSGCSPAGGKSSSRPAAR